VRVPLGCALAVSIALLAAPVAWAGHPQGGKGFWIGLGAGWGSAGIDCDDCGTEDREGSFTGNFKLGGTLSDRVLLGVESNGWIKDEGSATLTLGSVTGTVTFYPKASSGFFLKAGGGGSFVDMEERFGDVTANVDKWGWGVLTGVGYDIRVWPNISITPSVQYYFGGPGDITFERDDVIRGFKQDVVDFTIGLTFH
jgi:hypothetical protein